MLSQKIRVAESNGEVRLLTEVLNSHFYACELKMCQKLAYPVVKSPTS